jgi:signal transduction histidine kinase
MNLFSNIDLLSVGIAIAGTVVLGFSIYFSNKKSITNRTFFYFALITAIWGFLNYISYKVSDPAFTLWILRFVLFTASLQAFFIFKLFYVFPNSNAIFSIFYKRILTPITFFVALATLTPIVIKDIVEPTLVGKGVSTPINGPGIVIFGIFNICLVFTSIFILLKKIQTSRGQDKASYEIILVGTLIMFSFIIIFNFILPSILNNVQFIPYGAVFTFPFIAFTSYAILKHKLFNIKVAGTALLAFILSVVTFLEIIFSSELFEVIFRSSVFVLVLLFSILLLKGVLREVEQREEIQNLAKNLSEVNDDLGRANVRLKELDQMKSEFVSLATHQIRAPLTAIKGYISLIQEGDYGPVTPEVSKAIDVVFQSTNNLVTIVGDFLDVSRIEQGRMKYDFKDFDIKELAKQVVTELKPNVEKRGLKLLYSCDENLDYHIFGDQGKIKQIIGNIIDNSIKYTPQGHVEVCVSKPTENKVLVKVSDTGVGINPKVLPKLFNKFTRADNANEVNILGTGLGLYVARQMVEAHQGKVWAESEGEGKGSQFYIELPVKAVLPSNNDSK